MQALNPTKVWVQGSSYSPTPHPLCFTQLFRMMLAWQAPPSQLHRPARAYAVHFLPSCC
jgi:hypothetical protein